MHSILIRLILVFMGSFVIALGSVLMIIVSNLGLHPFDVLEYALTEKFGLTFGKWHWIVGGGMILLAFLVNHRPPKIGVFLETFLVDAFIDFLLGNLWIPNVQHGIVEWIYLLLGIGLIGIGTGMYIAADIGAGPSDWFSLALSEKTGISYRITTTFTEVSAVILGFLLNGPVFIGTLVFSIIYGPIMVYSLDICKVMVESIGKTHIKRQNENRV